MNALWVALFSMGALLAGYLLYGRFISRKILQLDPNRPTPAHAQEDGRDPGPVQALQQRVERPGGPVLVTIGG